MNICWFPLPSGTKRARNPLRLWVRAGGDIVNQIFVRSNDFDILGGVLGVLYRLASAALSVLLISVLPARIPSWAVFTGLGVSVGVGLIFGVCRPEKPPRLTGLSALVRINPYPRHATRQSAIFVKWRLRHMPRKRELLREYLRICG